MKTSSIALLAAISVSALAVIGLAEARAAFHDFDSEEW